MFNGDDPSYDGHRGHNNTRGWQTETFGHDKLKFRHRDKLKVASDKELRVAAKEGDSSRVIAIVNQGVDVNKEGGSHKNTALHYAARFGHLHCIEALLRLGANPNQRNAEGRTPLHWAASNGTARACQLLIEARTPADSRIRGKDGMTALELASHFNNAQTIPVLRAAAGLGKDEHHVCAERVGVWGGKDVPQAPAGGKHNKHLGRDEVSVQRVGVWHNSWAHYPTVNTPNDRRHKYQGAGEGHYGHGRQNGPSK